MAGVARPRRRNRLTIPSMSLKGLKGGFRFSLRPITRRRRNGGKSLDSWVAKN